MMVSKIPKPALAAAATVCAIALVYIAWSQPWYFTSQTYLGRLILLELVIAAIWKFRQVFFTVLIVVFLLAGTRLPGSSIFTSARWLVLGVGAVVGFLMLVKDHRHHFGIFHGIAFFAVLAAAVSASVSRYPSISLLKVFSLFLLFLYASSGARLAVKGREALFFARLLLGCEVLVGIFAVNYLFLGTDLVGNPNSLGAILGVAVAPLLLWGTFVAENASTGRRRFFLYGICAYMLFQSHARAGIAAAALSCGLLCVGLRRYRSLITGVAVILILVATAAILQPERLFETASTMSSEMVYKGIQGGSVLASRELPWKDAVNTIRSHFWFGTGFGTTDKGHDAKHRLGSFSSNSEVAAEYGSSYLEIATWVGMLGVLPFIILLLALMGKVLRTMSWLLTTRNAAHPAIPVALVIAAALVHAAFEDWMFAPGYYLCVFFWSMSFVLVDIVPVWTEVPTQHSSSQFSRFRLGQSKANEFPQFRGVAAAPHQ